MSYTKVGTITIRHHALDYLDYFNIDHKKEGSLDEKHQMLHEKEGNSHEDLRGLMRQMIK